MGGVLFGAKEGFGLTFWLWLTEASCVIAATWVPGRETGKGLAKGRRGGSCMIGQQQDRIILLQSPLNTDTGRFLKLASMTSGLHSLQTLNFLLRLFPRQDRDRYIGAAWGWAGCRFDSQGGLSLLPSPKTPDPGFSGMEGLDLGRSGFVGNSGIAVDQLCGVHF